MSLLVRQHLALKQAFSRRYPHGWVVWEAGAWNVTDTGEQNIARTRLPTEDLRDCLPQGDVLCFELAPPADGRALSVGRSSENDVVLNDATVSREHLALKFADGRWSVEARSITEARLHGRAAAAPGRAGEAQERRQALARRRHPHLLRRRRLPRADPRRAAPDARGHRGPEPAGGARAMTRSSSCRGVRPRARRPVRPLVLRPRPTPVPVKVKSRRGTRS